MGDMIKDYRLEPPAYPEPPVCPVCGSNTYHDVYKGEDGIVGCDECVMWIPAEEHGGRFLCKRPRVTEKRGVREWVT